MAATLAEPAAPPRFSVVLDDYTKNLLAHRTKKTTLLDENGDVIGYYYPVEVDKSAYAALTEKWSRTMTPEELREHLKGPRRTMTAEQRREWMRELADRE